MMRTVLSLLLALTLGVSVAEERPATERPKLIVGVTEFALSEDGRDITEALHRAAAPLADQYDLEFRSMPVPELERAARERRVDLVLGSAGLVVRLADAGAKPIVTTLGPGAINANQNEGSAFLVRRDREDLQTLGDLAGKNLVANRPSGFSGYLIAMGEIALAGNDPDHFFSSRTFIGAQNASHEIARQVRYGFADVGTLRLCAWEELLEKDPSAAKDLRILAPKESRSACVHSTDLYPAHTLAALPHVTPEAVTATTLAFLRMPPTERGRSWAVATDYLSIDKLFRALKTGPYRYLREPVWKRFLAEYFPFILIFLGVALLFLWQFENTKRLLEKRTLEVRRLAQKEAEQERRLLFLERNTMVSQLSSMLAHELHQPLAAIRLYARGLVKLLARTNPSPEVTEAADAIADEATRAKEIVERVRAYARNRRAERKETPLSEILQNAVSHFQSGAKAPVPLTISGDTDVVVSVSALEIELVFVNLLKNAREAAMKGPNPKISITVRRDDRRVAIDVRDNGPVLDEEARKRLTMPVSSEKPEGLGLGLGIARGILEQHAGKLEFSVNAPEPGLTATVTLPLPHQAKPEEHPEA